ncbi:hypothetical protein [uncultured Duncaniella sp.]|uniref:hypothetical protein n=1 Tax=uncultured Duncaniella sp. TaxID=2768039 RepID=UPI0025A9798B|nr:hypothetical protein [uncultured Duncaniella sp.]
MSDKRFKWLLIITSLTVIIVAAIWKYPETVKAHENRQVKLGEYVYIDHRNIIHVSRKCPKLNYKGFKSKRVKVEELRGAMNHERGKDFTFCPNCVSDRDYEELSRRIR